MNTFLMCSKLENLRLINFKRWYDESYLWKWECINPKGNPEEIGNTN